MSAVKIIFKRSSLLGKRPTGQNLEAGEIALNTNANDPGLFFEVNDGSVAKVGPTAYLPGPPTGAPSLGELWVDRDTKALSIGTEANKWQAVGAPFLGGTSGLTVFVAPEFPNATDSLANDGQTVPFITINRAVLEVTKNIILDTVSGRSLGNNRYLIVLAPGQHCVVNRPGITTFDFNYDLTDSYQAVTQDLLAAFNPETVGGLILPRGVSIIGMDLKKCEVRPSYVPKYTHPSFPRDYSQVVGGLQYRNQPLSSIFRWSGNTYLTNFSGTDKVESCIVTKVSSQRDTGAAIFRSNQPHGLDYNDFVEVSYTDSADRAGSTFLPGQYYAYPLNNYEFTLSVENWTSQNAIAIAANTLPPSYFLEGENLDPKFNVLNIYPYYVPLTDEPYEYSLYSHHRLSVVKNATLSQLNNYYIKVQKAFPDFFGGQVNLNLVSAPEYEIVAPASASYPSNKSSNSNENASPYLNTVNLRSNYGLSLGDFDGNLVTGFKSVIVNSSTAVSLQKDPVAYELYSATTQSWVQLTSLTQQEEGGVTPVVSIPISRQLQTLNEIAIPDIRYYYTCIQVEDPANAGVVKSSGVADPDNDFRFFGFRVSGPNTYMQSECIYTIGPAISVWAKDGALISLTNATTNFGSVAIQADGFSGIGTLGGANEINKGFLQAGVMLPLALSDTQVNSDAQKKTLSLGSKVVFVEPDPNSAGVQLVYLKGAFDPSSILPFSLRPDTAVYVTDGQCTYRAFFVTNGEPTVILSEADSHVNPYAPGGAILRVRYSDSNIPNGPASETCLDIPYIRRFVDPRTPSQKAYGFYIESTNPTSQAPQPGSVFRLNQTGQNLSTTLKRNYQFDPGQYGGIAQVFTVDLVETAPLSLSTNYNNKISDDAQSSAYVVYTSLTDASSPWIQSIEINGSLVPFNHPKGSYLTYNNRNFFAAENDLWSSLYYDTTFNPLNGPTKVSPNKPDSSFVTTSVLQKEEPISASWQGYVPDPYYEYYTNKIPSPYKDNLTYMRGAVIPYQDFAGSFWVDIDDSSQGMGIIYSREAVGPASTMTADSAVIQTGVAMTTPYVASPTFGRPATMTLQLLRVAQVVNPKNGLSVVRVSNPRFEAYEYVRVIAITSNTLTVIRNYYPEYSNGTPPTVWPAGSTVTVCYASCFPEPSVYDPSWSVTKATMFRFFELMGYKRQSMVPYLNPKYAGERVLYNTDLPLSPLNGYANMTAKWPTEFNNPSTIISNTHNWQYAGYLDYSRGLPKYQVNEISRKLQFDYFSTSSWGGRLTVTGADQNGSVVFLGPLREGLTGSFYNYVNPSQTYYDNIVSVTPQPIENYPNPILVFSADDISGEFDGSKTLFDLKRGGLAVPTSQLNVKAMFVTVGGVMQIPEQAYTLGDNGGVTTSSILFSSPPPAGSSCDVRIVTSDDNEKTLQVLSYTPSNSFDGSRSTFSLTPSKTGIDNDNSFIFLGGIAQTPFASGHPDPAYLIANTPAQTTINFIGGAPLANLDYDFRAIVSGANFRAANYPIVNVIAIDDISVFFDGALTSFPLYADNLPLNPAVVNAENMFVTLGAVIQIPHKVAGDPLAGNAYTVAVNKASKLLEITFAAPPMMDTSCTIRVVSSEPKDFLICPLPEALQSQPIVAGDGVIVDENNMIISIDSSIID